MEQLNELDEIQLVTVHNTSAIQQQQTKSHDKFINRKVFQRENWAFLYDSQLKYFKGKIFSRWMGPYEVDKIFDNGTIKLTTIDEAHTPLFVKKHRLIL